MTDEAPQIEAQKLIRELIKFDPVASPAHYTQGGIQPIDYIRANKLDFCEGNVVKYVTRHRHKNGVEDLKKARQYLDWLIGEYDK